MTEYINKAELLRKLKKLATEAWMSNLKAKVETTINACIDVIDNEPIVDIVRCKDCKHYDKFIRLCDIGHSACAPNWFCADMRRSENDD